MDVMTSIHELETCIQLGNQFVVQRVPSSRSIQSDQCDFFILTDPFQTDGLKIDLFVVRVIHVELKFSLKVARRVTADPTSVKMIEQHLHLYMSLAKHLSPSSSNMWDK